ncbi:TSUP family transporter [Rhizobium sp. PAMB 3174]
MTEMAGASIYQYALVAAVAFFASILGGVSGYGTGLLLPPVLIPIIGAQAVVPVIGLASILTNLGRLAAYRDKIEWKKAGLVLAAALPFTPLGAYAYTWLSGTAVTMLIGCMIIILVPARRVLARRKAVLPPAGLAAASAGFGLMVGGTAGSGVFLISILLAAGLSGASVIATDAGVSFLLGIAKTAVFQASGFLPSAMWIMSILIGVCAIPGAFVARRLTRRMSDLHHVYLLDAVVIFGGALIVVEAFRAGL